MLKILALDPSGTGTTGIYLNITDPACRYYSAGFKERFLTFTSPEWKLHLGFISKLVAREKPNLIIYENTNYINSRGKDMTSLLKLIGAIDCLPVQQTDYVLVGQVKDLKSKLFKGKATIKGLEFKPGKGWFYQNKKISVHQLDAFLVYWLWKEKHAH